jgi:CheY-like chemotaxis protein
MTQTYLHLRNVRTGSKPDHGMTAVNDLEKRSLRSMNFGSEIRPIENLEPADSAATMKRVVVVDDNQDAAESLAMLLGMSGHEVRVAFDGPAGLALAQEYAPDIMLIDIGLPGMDGYEVARRVREQEQGRRALLIAATGYGQSEDRACSSSAGFDHHFVKPLALDALINLIGSAPISAADGSTSGDPAMSRNHGG